MKSDYEWQKPYAVAVLETDRSKLAQRIDEACTAISARVVELAQDHFGTPEERLAIEFALSSLKVLIKDSASFKQIY